MQQLPLLTIRKRALKPEEISSAVIRAYVKQKLQGYSERQAERVKRRNGQEKVSIPTLFDMEETHE